ncbi:MAG: UDP-glucose 4-epimerase GalE [Alphaproteobacteria bacterium]|nr:UDP-glucose 4-epimerase GalE [Alphaproteobacteria bacterium]
MNIGGDILVTGGTGYIGSHVCVALLQNGYKVTILDNLCNSRQGVVDRIEAITGIRPAFIQGDIRDAAMLDRIFSERPFHAVMHFAGLKAVKESVQKPLEYYDNNINGTLHLLSAMRRAGVKTFIFSSSATVYGDPERSPVREDAPRAATNPYGRSKLMIEDILADLYHSETGWRLARLRYFNPVGAHESGLIGESPLGVPNNLMPFIAQVAIGRREKLFVYGADYPTPDGTGIRDYIHVMDLAEGHLAALRHCGQKQGLFTVNLGTGQGYSVMEMIRAFGRACGHDIPYEINDRRPGDIAACWANPALALSLLGWHATRDIDAMCADSWRWIKNNPNGYATQHVTYA